MPAMGRKPVPQPLTLGESVGSVDKPRVGEILPISSPSDSNLSPKSPRSPFRFAQPKQSISNTVSNGATGGKHTLSPSEFFQQQQQQEKERHIPDDDLSFIPPLASAAHPAFEQQRALPPTRHVQQSQHRPLQLRAQHNQEYHHVGGTGHRSHRHDDEKSSKSGFFFNFKSAKSSDRLNTHQHTDSRGETMSRDTDHPALSRQHASNHSGKNQRPRPVPGTPPSCSAVDTGTRQRSRLLSLTLSLPTDCRFGDSYAHS
jgi:hypothetical protein